MNRLTTRLLIAAAVIGLTHAAVLGLQDVRVPTVTRPLKRAIADLPRELGPWKDGQDEEVDKRTITFIDALGGDQHISRSYRTEQGRVVRVHVASYAVTVPGLPNRPLDCYPNSGWTIVSDRTIQVPDPAGSPFPVRVLDLTMQDRTARVFYWYQMGDDSIVDRGQTRFSLASYRGEAKLDPTIKVMIHEDSPAAESVDEELRDLIQTLSEFSKNL